MPDPEPYTYELTRRARRDLAELPRGVAEACAVFIHERLVANPRRIGGPPMTGRWEGCRNAHVAGYRVVFRRDDERRHLLVVHIGPRGTVYNG